MDPLTMDIDFTTDGEYEQHGEIKIVMTTEQADKLAELLARHIDLDVVAMDNEDGEGAMFVDLLIAGIHRARGTQDPRADV